MKFLNNIVNKIISWAGTLILNNTSEGDIVDFQLNGVSKSKIDSTGKYVGDVDTLDGEHGAYYLDRDNHTGTQSADSITDGITNKIFTASDKIKLDNIEDGAEVNINADWNAISGDAQILNKPTLGTASTKNIGLLEGNIPILIQDGKLDASVFPDITITDTFVVANETAMLSLVAQKGDVAVRTDESKSYILVQEPASTLSNWQELLSPSGSASVLSVNSKTGVVVINGADVHLTGYEIAETPSDVVSTDSINVALGKIEKKNEYFVTAEDETLGGTVPINADLLNGQTSSHYLNSINQSYDNTESGLSSSNVQYAIDELSLEKMPITGGTFTNNVSIENPTQYVELKVKSLHDDAFSMLKLRDVDETGFDITYDKANDSFSVNKTINNNYDSTLLSFNSGFFSYKGNTVWHSGNLVLVADGVTYDNTESQILATNVQDAIDEIKTDITDGLNNKIVLSDILVTGQSVGDIWLKIL